MHASVPVLSGRGRGLVVGCLVALGLLAAQVSGPPPAGAYPTRVDPRAGTVIASSGFEVKRDGFSFRNWGPNADGHRRGLDPTQMQILFGPGVCARSIAGICSLTTTAELVQKFEMASASGGHCLGMAAMAGLLREGRISKVPYGLPWQSVYQMPISGQLDATISRLFSTQSFPPTSTAIKDYSVSAALATLTDSWRRGKQPMLAFYTADKEAGHAVTPIKIRDIGGGKRGIVLYDNNFPGEETMMVTDPAANTWYYTTAANPADDSYLFDGSPANGLQVIPVDQTLARHDCPQCAANPSSTRLMVTDTNGTDVERGVPVGDVDWDLTLTDLAGQPIPGAGLDQLFDNDEARVMTVPRGRPFRVTISGVPQGPPARINLTGIAGEWAATLDQIAVPHDASVTIEIDPARQRIAMASTRATGAAVAVASENSVRSVGTTVTGIRLIPGARVLVEPGPLGQVAVRSYAAPQSLLISAERSDVFVDRTARSAGPIAVGAGSSVSVPIGLWTGWEPIGATVASGNRSRTVPLSVG